MMEDRNRKLAQNLVKHSCKVEKGDKVWIDLRGKLAIDLAGNIIEEVYKAGGVPFVQMSHQKLNRELLMQATEEQLKLMAEIDVMRAKQMDAFIAINCPENKFELSDVPQEKMQMRNKLYGRRVYNEILIPNTKWVLIEYPSESMAQLSGMSHERFKDFYYDVCNLDYGKMGKAMKPLKELMERTDKVRIEGNGTSLSFSIKGIEVIACAGENNIPDGEIFTAPVKESVNGVLKYNAPSTYNDFRYNDIKLKFKDGKIIEAESNDTERLNKVLDSDEGARYIGEFAIGVNPYITDPMSDILFDEKIKGSFHFTPGNSYEEANNGNKSSIHWDLVCIQTEKYGGGEIYFDDVLVRKDGIFVLPELLCLNPENLK